MMILNPLVIKRSNYFCSTLMFWTRRLDEMLSDDDMRTLFSSTQSVPVRLSSCCRDRSVCLSSSNFLLHSHLLMVPMASQPLMASLAYVHNTHRHTRSHAQTHTRYHTCTHTYTHIHTHTHTNTHMQHLPFLSGLYSLCLACTFPVHILIMSIKIKSTPPHTKAIKFILTHASHYRHLSAQRAAVPIYTDYLLQVLVGDGLTITL